MSDTAPPPAPPPPAPQSTALQAATEKANQATIEHCSNLQKGAHYEGIDKVTANLRSSADTAKRQLTVMAGVVFALGIFLFFFAILLTLAGRTIDGLGLGSLGTANYVALFFWGPMDRIQNAEKEFMRQVVLLTNWSINVDLQLLAMKVGESASVTAAATNLETDAEKTIQLLGQALDASPGNTPAGNTD